MSSRPVAHCFTRGASSIGTSDGTAKGREARRLVGALFGFSLLTFTWEAHAEDDWLGPDKLLHFGAATALAGGGYAASSLVFDPKLARAAAGFGIAVGLGAAKEGVDALGYGDPSGKDFAWDVAGALVGSALALVVDSLLFDESSGDAATRANTSVVQGSAGPSATVALRF